MKNAPLGEAKPNSKKRQSSLHPSFLEGFLSVADVGAKLGGANEKLMVFLKAKR